MVGDREKCLAAQMDVSGCALPWRVLVLTRAIGLPVQASSSESAHSDDPPLRHCGKYNLRSHERAALHGVIAHS